MSFRGPATPTDTILEIFGKYSSSIGAEAILANKLKEMSPEELRLVNLESVIGYAMTPLDKSVLDGLAATVLKYVPADAIEQKDLNRLFDDVVYTGSLEFITDAMPKTIAAFADEKWIGRITDQTLGYILEPDADLDKNLQKLRQLKRNAPVADLKKCESALLPKLEALQQCLHAHGGQYANALDEVCNELLPTPARRKA